MAYPEIYTPDKLLAGDFPRVYESVTIASGANLVAGAVLGIITSSGKYALSAAAAGDGSEVPRAILLKDAAAAAADVSNVPVALTGEFNQNALTFGTGHTAASTKTGLRDIGIFLKTTVQQP